MAQLNSFDVTTGVDLQEVDNAVNQADKEIASELGLPLNTARTYVARVLKRLGVSSRRELMRRG